MLELQRFLIKEQAAAAGRADTCIILDPDTRQPVGIARVLTGNLTKVLPGFLGKRFGPTQVRVCEMEDEPLVFSLRWPLSLWRERVEIYDADDHLVGSFRSRLFSRGRAFSLYDGRSRRIADVAGDGAGRGYRLVTPDGHELASVTRQATETGEDCHVAIHDMLSDQPIAKMLVLAAALAIELLRYETPRAKVERTIL